MRDEEKYYTLYEDRYRGVYAQGIEYYQADPEENEPAIGRIDRFLRRYDCQPSTTSIIEFGFGEGNVASYLLGHGYKYPGGSRRTISIRHTMQTMEQSSSGHLRYKEHRIHADSLLLLHHRTGKIRVPVDPVS